MAPGRKPEHTKKTDKTEDMQTTRKDGCQD